MILTSDSGSSANWFARDLRIRKGMMASLSGNLATMGPGVPYAIAAKFAHPDRPVIALVGDGAMQMNGLDELITIGKYWQRWSDPRLIVLVLNNRDLNQVTWEQRAMAGDPKFEGSQDLPDFPYAGYAEMLGLRGIKVEDPDAIAVGLGSGARIRPAGRPRGGHRPGGAAAAAAHHDRAGQGADLGAGQARPRLGPDHQAVLQAEGPGVRAGAMTGSTATIGAPVDSLSTSQPTRFRPTARRETGRCAGTRRRSSSSRLGVPAESGLGYTYANEATASLVLDELAEVVEGARRDGAASDLGRDGRRDPQPRAARHRLDGDRRGRYGDLGPEGAARGRSPVRPARAGAGERSDLRQRRIHDLLGIERWSSSSAGWVEHGIPRVKMKVGSGPGRRTQRRAASVRAAIGPEAELFVDANGALTRKDALLAAERFRAEADVSWFEEPVSSDDLAGLRLLRDRAPAGMAIAAGEYGYDATYFARMVDAGAVDVLQADVTRCAGITELLRVDSLCRAHQVPLSLHCGPAIHSNRRWRSTRWSISSTSTITCGSRR